MTKMSFKEVLLGMTVLTLVSHMSNAQQPASTVKIVGEMKNVMWKGQLYGSINLDTIANKTNLYGLGPVEHLAGEILIIGGKSYKSTVVSDTTMEVEETYDIKAPFFGYANVANWTEQALPDSVQTIKQLEQFLDSVTKNSSRPFMFKLTGTVEQATIHVVNLPKGSKVSSPDDAHKGQKKYELKNEKSEIIGFFSTEHKAVFTHHDTFLHMHLITNDLQKMGHLDAVLFEKGTMKIYLPAE
jgi:acetolactate decarboxylase